MTFITLQEFRQWLESQPPGVFVGLGSSAILCPLARAMNQRLVSYDKLDYLAVEGTVPMIHVHPTMWWVELPTSKGPGGCVPSWAGNFIRSIDHMVGTGHATAGQCLEILNSQNRKEIPNGS